MEKFQPLSTEKVRDREKKTSKYWEEIDLLHLSITEREDSPAFVFYEGPPTANGRPGIHHVISRTLKDMTCRYKTMQGFQVKRKAGWDTHGLPVEIEVEKRLGLSDKQDIEKYGVEKFNKKCRESVFEYEKEWREMTERMAYLIDLDNPYITLDNNYIETIWWILDNMFKDGLIYEGHKILPYCSRCGTGLASHEVAQGYEEIKTETVYAKFKLKDKDEYFLAWTTTPWTLPSNIALAVNPNIEYIKVKSQGEIYYLAKDLADEVLIEEYEILESFKGKELEYIEYEQLIPMLEVKDKAFYVVCADYVTVEDGTGIVHQAPAFGEDDYYTARDYDLPVVNPVGEDGKFLDTIWKGEFVMDADPKIIEYLRNEGKLYRKQKFEHNYPHCWRCHTPLLYYARPSWYIRVSEYKDKLVENNKKVNWYPKFVGEKRFGNWLENLEDWALSRSRYWGTPLPIWRCEECGKLSSCGSIEELKERAIENIDGEVDLHRPFVDNIHFECECGNQMRREPDVIDVWFDSGAMPFAQHHYPFEHKDDFEQLFPADFINEGIDQTRGWFNSLLNISTYVTGKSPFKNVLVNDLVLDKEGKKMSKSRGNTVNPFDLFDKYGADAVRWYLLYVSPPWTPTMFDEMGIVEVESKFFRTLRNVYNFFSLYANTDGVDPRDFEIDVESRTEIDRWIISKYNNLTKTVTKDMEIFEVTKAVRTIQNFVVEDLSNWYIRRCRRRFWKTELDDDKKAVYKTTYEILEGISKMIAPMVPYIAEELYHNLNGGKSVHIEHYPKWNEKYIDPQLEHKMDLVRDIVTLGRACREEVGIKVRQPLSEIVIDGNNKEIIGSLTDLIKEELNVKNVDFEQDLTRFMNYNLKPNFRVAGRILGSKIKSFAKYLTNVDAKEFVQKLENENVEIELNGEMTEILKDYIEVKIEAKEGFDIKKEGELFVILDTTLTDELIAEGYAREFISKVQQMRKAENLDVLDNIQIEYTTEDKVADAIKAHEEIIKSETLAKEIIRTENLKETEELNGVPTAISITKIN
ncbi:MAG: isoleucine--tRNA ligase [Tissierellia bacterium]|nr:isoleucine--tRNA ligase [Tissierellia bacterium]